MAGPKSGASTSSAILAWFDSIAARSSGGVDEKLLVGQFRRMAASATPASFGFFILLGGACAASSRAVEPVAWWDFQEPAGQPRMARGRAPFALQETNGPIERVTGAPGGRFAARMDRDRRQFFVLPRAKLGALNIHGPDARLTVAALVRRRDTRSWQAIAGVWDESRGLRQYFLFVDGTSQTNPLTMTRSPIRHKVHGHVSDVGEPTPGHEFCVTYATGDSVIETGAWRWLAMTFDGSTIKIFVDGVLDAAAPYNPFPFSGPVFDGGADGADFTVGAVSVKGAPGNFFGGDIAQLAVFDRALTASEVSMLSGR